MIDSLRNNAKAKKDTLEVDAEANASRKEQDLLQENSTFVSSEPKTSSQTNNFLSVNESEKGLKVKPKIGVGDRDKLKKKQLDLDNNPEI